MRLPLALFSIDAKSELKKEGYTVAELRAAGYSAKDLKFAGFDSQLLRAAGYLAEEMRLGGYSLRELIRDIGYSAKELKVGGFTAHEYVAVPCSVTPTTHTHCTTITVLSLTCSLDPRTGAHYDVAPTFHVDTCAPAPWPWPKLCVTIGRENQPHQSPGLIAERPH